MTQNQKPCKAGSLETFAREALSTLAARDLKAAQLFAERCTDKNARTQAGSAIIAGVAQSDPVKAAVLALAGKDETELFRDPAGGGENGIGRDSAGFANAR